MNDIAKKISIIIPTLNEANNIDRAIASIPISQPIEVIIVDGGSSDRTVEIAQAKSIKVLTATGGRAVQMNTGARVATGEILLFLHADTILPPDFVKLVRSSLLPVAARIPVAGAFALKIDAPQWQLRLVEWGANWRSRYGQMPYGDQAIFLTAKTFQQVGGFPELPIMEDFQLMRQLGRLGRIEIVSTPVVTSARRWLKRGIIQTTAINQLIILAYFAGVSPTQLSRWYRTRSKISLTDWLKTVLGNKDSEL
jgi:rSAM/selenodomain-associated transferase 2